MSQDIEITSKEEAIAAIEAGVEFLKSEESSGEETGGEETTTVTIPSPDEVDELDKSSVLETAESIGLTVEGKKAVEVRPVLKTLALINAGEDVEDQEEIDAVAESLGLPPDPKKPAKTLAAIKTWIENLGSAGEENTEETTEDEEETKEEESTEDEEETKDEETTEEEPKDEDEKAEKPAEENPDSDGVDREAIAAKFKKFPDLKTMIKHLTAYNEKVTESEKENAEEIEFNPKKEQSVKDAYRKLVAELVSSGEEIAAWGTAYIRDNGGWCCGLPLEETKIKGVKRHAGECVVTGKKFVLNESEDGFDEHEE